MTDQGDVLELQIPLFSEVVRSVRLAYYYDVFNAYAEPPIRVVPGFYATVRTPFNSLAVLGLPSDTVMPDLSGVLLYAAYDVSAHVHEVT